jgi:hypothetical protein
MRFSSEQLDQIEATRLSDVIKRNTKLQQVQPDVFRVPANAPPIASTV